MQPRKVAFIGAIGVIVGWLVASTLTPPVARVQTRPQERPTPDAKSEDMQFTEQLQLRLRQAPPAPAGRRNPFAFAARERAVTSSAPLERSTDSPALVNTPLNLGPTFILSGIGIDGTIKTAVLTTTGDDVRIVKVNDVIGQFTVAEISEQSVTLVRGDERFVLRFP